MKSTEIYAFVGWIASFISYVIYILWGFLPEEVIKGFGIQYYPHKSWAIAVPCLFCMSAIFLFTVY